MNTIVRKVLLWGTLILILVAVNYQIWSFETFLQDGESIYLELAPVDPRSLIQGDYMVLRYEIGREMQTDNDQQKAVITLDENQIATFERFHDEILSLQNNERLLNFRLVDRRVLIGAESFFFQEGQAEIYQNARYAELKIRDDGTVLLVGLRDENLSLLKPESSE